MNVLTFLRDNYNVTIKNNLVNCTELIKLFNVKDVDMSDYNSKKKINGDTYIDNSDCLKFILNNNITELLFLINSKHKCDRCEKIFSSKQRLQTHSKINCLEEKHKCLICNKKYASRTTLIKHQKSQKHIKASTIIESRPVTEMNNNNNCVAKIDNSINKTVINLIIPRNDFYDSGLWNKLSEEKQLDVLRSENCIKTLIKATHFDKDKPEYHNVMSENIREKRGAIYTDGEWQSKKLGKIATELMENKTKDVKLILEKHKLSLSKEDVAKVDNCLRRIVNITPEEIVEHGKNTAGMSAVQALESSNELVQRMNRIDENKKELCEEIQMIIYDHTKKLGLKRN